MKIIEDNSSRKQIIKITDTLENALDKIDNLDVSFEEKYNLLYGQVYSSVKSYNSAIGRLN